MKKALLLALLVTTFSVTANAQLFKIGRIPVGYIYAGPHQGINMSFNNVAAGSGNTRSANYGYQYGLAFRFGVADKLSIQPELLFTTKGYVENTASSTQTNNYRYFGAPVVVKYAFLSFSSHEVYCAAGVYTDVLIGGDINVVTDKSFYPPEKESEYNFTSKISKDELTSSFNRTDFGFNIGLGTNFKLKNKDRFNIDLSYSFGTTDVLNTDSDGFASSESSKNMFVKLSAAYMFDVTKWINFNKE